MRRFILLRVEDVSGSSGTGVVAKGIVAPNGMVVLCFADTIKIIPSIEKMMEIHSHGGRTRFHWQDWPEEPRVAQCECGHDETFHQSRGRQCDYGSGSDLVPREGPACTCTGFQQVSRTWHPGVPPEGGFFLVRRTELHRPSVTEWDAKTEWKWANFKGGAYQWSRLRL